MKLTDIIEISVNLISTALTIFIFLQWGLEKILIWDLIPIGIVVIVLILWIIKDFLVVLVHFIGEKVFDRFIIFPYWLSWIQPTTEPIWQRIERYVKNNSAKIMHYLLRVSSVILIFLSILSVTVGVFTLDFCIGDSYFLCPENSMVFVAGLSMYYIVVLIVRTMIEGIVRNLNRKI